MNPRREKAAQEKRGPARLFDEADSALGLRGDEILRRIVAVESMIFSPILSGVSSMVSPKGRQLNWSAKMNLANAVALAGMILVFLNFLSQRSWHILESLQHRAPEEYSSALMSWAIAHAGALILSIAGGLYFVIALGFRAPPRRKPRRSVNPIVAVAFGTMLIAYGVGVGVSGCADDYPRITARMAKGP